MVYCAIDYIWLNAIGATPSNLAHSLLININNEVEVVRQYDFSSKGGLMMQYRILKSQAIALPCKSY